MSSVAARRKERHNTLQFPLRSLPSRPNAAYVRKSTESEDRQSKSLDQQLADIRTKCPDLPDDMVWSDSKSGTNFDSRDGIVDFLAFATMHPQPKGAFGILWMWDETRFGRPLDEDGEVDADMWTAWRLKFKAVGWMLRFIETPESGNAASDDMVRTMKTHMGSQFSKELSRKVRRGKNDWLEKGYWVGKPPWPTARYDRNHDRLLLPIMRDDAGEIVRSAEPSVNGCELRGNPPWLEHWNWAAEEIVSGHTLDDVAHRLNKRGSTTAQGNRWHRGALEAVLSNRALIGELSYIDKQNMAQTSKAKWESIVDPELFKRVQTRLLAGRKGPKIKRKTANEYVLDSIYCAYCGARYFGTPACNKNGKVRIGPDGAVVRQYRHPSIRSGNLGTQDTYKRAVTHGCKKWTIPADIAEGAARDLMENLRGSADWAKEVAEMFQNQRTYKNEARGALREAEDCVERLNDELANILGIARNLKSGGAAQRKLASEIETLSDKIAEAENEVVIAQEQVANTNVAFGYVKELIDETRQMALAWDSSDDQVAKRRILDRWISSIWVVVDQREGERHSRNRALHFFLHSSPNDPRVVAIPNRQGDNLRKKSSAPETHAAQGRQVLASVAPGEGVEPLAGALGKGDLNYSVGRTSLNSLPFRPELAQTVAGSLRAILAPQRTGKAALLRALQQRAVQQTKQAETCRVGLAEIEHIVVTVPNAQGHASVRL